VICAGFIDSPIRGPLRLLLSFLAPALFRFGVPEIVISRLLLGKTRAFTQVQRLRAAISSVSGRVLTYRLRAVLECDERAELGKVAVPILYIRANMDRLVGKSSFEAIQRIKPDASLARIGSAHLILQAEPQRAVDTVVEFLEQNS
jgi:pimeloyl-ACP methyl ester carboxylesterase